jgi:hypothetical protein
MFSTKLKIVAALLLAGSMVGAAASVLLYGGVARGQDESKRIAPKVRPEANVQPASRSQSLAAAREELRHMEEQYQVQERTWIKELVQARLHLTDLEDKLKIAEGALTSDEMAVEYAKLKAALQDLEEAEPRYRDKKHPALETRRAHVREQEKHYRDREQARRNELMLVRKEFSERKKNSGSWNGCKHCRGKKPVGGWKLPMSGCASWSRILHRPSQQDKGRWN